MLTIGEFSKLSHISARMLRHYDALGLLRPAHTGQENGYRYYDVSQLDTLARIERLKGYGFTLSQIPALLTLPESELSERLHTRRLAAYTELNALHKTLRRMERDIETMEGSKMNEGRYHVITMTIPAQRVYGIRRVIHVGQIHDLFQELKAQLAERGLRLAGVTQLLYHGEEFSYERMDAEAQAQVSGEDEAVREIPEQLCVAVNHTGPYDELHFAYEALGRFMASHPEYEVCGPSIERYIRDENMARDEEELETGVMFPIRLKTEAKP